MTAPGSHDSRSRNRPALLGLAAAVLMAILFSLCLGVYPVSVSTVLKILCRLVWPFSHGDLSGTEKEQMVVEAIRLPRILLAAAAGAGLGVSGAALQGLMRNPLVGPDLIGVTSGASFGGVVAILLGWPAYGIVLLAFCGGLLALVLASAISRLANGGILALVLTGMVVGAFFSSLVGLAQYVADPESKLPQMVYWLMGSFAGATWEKVLTLCLPTALAGSLLIGLRWRINLLSLGDLDAASLGVPVRSLRWVIICLVSGIVAAQVSVSGGVGWVGLVVPHLARMLVGPDHRTLLPASALLGALYTLGMDDIARCLTSQELPIGLLTSLVGTPVFAFLFWRTQTRGWCYE